MNNEINSTVNTLPPDHLSFRSLASFGKRQEYVVIAELLKRGFDVYQTLVDDQQIDCILRRGRNDYIDIQIKARSALCKPYDAGRFAAMDIPDPRENYYFIFYSEQAGCYWIIPSSQLAKISSCNKKGSNIGKFHINLAGHSTTTDKVYPLPRFDKYKNNFNLLKDSHFE